MPIDAEVAAIFEQNLRAVPPPDFASLQGTGLQRHLAQIRSRPRSAATPELVDEVTERRVSDRDVPVRIYRPQADTVLPLLVYMHGGGWVAGDLETHDATCRYLANQVGAVIVNVDYRLAPEHPYPEPLDDCWAVVEWVSEHAEQLGVDRFGVAGSSAGGNLAAAIALRARDAGGPTLAAQVLIYPVLDSTMSAPSFAMYGADYYLTTDQMQWYWTCYVPDANRRTEPRASPSHAIDLGGVAQALIVTAEFDPLRDEGERYADRLRVAGVPTTLIRIEGQPHGFLGLAGVAAQPTAARQAIAGLVRTCLGHPRSDTDATPTPTPTPTSTSLSEH